MIPVDFLGRELKVGQRVVKVSVCNSTPHFQLKEVTRVEDGRVYLNGWHSPVEYSSRLVVAEDVK